MSQWVINGLRTGIKTTVYPGGVEQAGGVTPGLPCGCDALSPSAAAALVDCCPTQVFSQNNGKVLADNRRCIHCYRCVRGIEHPSDWQQTYEWAAVRNAQNEFDRPFRRSIHICVVDAGDCGACLNEVKQLNNPYYNMHRLGFFITPITAPRRRAAGRRAGDGAHAHRAEKDLRCHADAETGGCRWRLCNHWRRIRQEFRLREGVAECCRWTWRCREIRRRLWRFCTVCCWRLGANQRRYSMRHRQSWRPMRRNSDGNSNAHPCFFCSMRRGHFAVAGDACDAAGKGARVAGLPRGDCFGVGGRKCSTCGRNIEAPTLVTTGVGDAYGEPRPAFGSVYFRHRTGAFPCFDFCGWRIEPASRRAAMDARSRC